MPNLSLKEALQYFLNKFMNKTVTTTSNGVMSSTDKTILDETVDTVKDIQTSLDSILNGSSSTTH